jgi:8-oxo-dGTP diphosphatase
MAARRTPDLQTDEQSFLEAYDPETFPRPSVAVDVAVVTVVRDRLRVLLYRRPDHPAKGRWSLPGGFVRMDESLDRAAERVLDLKAGLRGVFLEQLYTFGEPGRDPRTRVISVAYYALVDHARIAAALDRAPGASLATLSVPWQGESGGPAEATDDSGRDLPLAFDHAEILGMVVKRLRGKLDYVPIGFQLLPRRFTLRTLQNIHETVLGQRLNKDSFRRRMLASGQLAGTGEREAAVGHRPAELYRFVAESAV